MNFVFITGNQNKVAALEHWLGHPVEHSKLDLEELQVLDDREVVKHKVEQAFAIFKKPVLVEDVYLSFNALGKLPGTFIKWFLEELKPEGCCRLLDGFNDRSARASITYALHDGQKIHYFTGETLGTIPKQPQGGGGFGWDSIFIPDNSTKTYAEMSIDSGDKNLMNYSVRNKAVQKLKVFLDAN